MWSIAFLFSLTNKDNKPLKIKIDPNYQQYAIHCHSSCGPSYGFGSDFCIANNANTTTNSYSFLGHTYIHPQYDEGTLEADAFFAGSFNFQLDEKNKTLIDEFKTNKQAQPLRNKIFHLK